MQHLPVPQNIEPLSITVPYIADGAPEYDGQGWTTFPQRCGYFNIPPRQDSDRSAAQKHTTTKEVQSFFQSWMYFGLLDEVFRDLETYCRDDFIQQADERGSLPTISTSKLSFYAIAKLSQRFLNLHGVIRHDDEARAEAHRIYEVLTVAIDQLHRWEVYAEFNSEKWTPLFLSTRVLIETLYNTFLPVTRRTPRTIGLTSGPSVDFVRRHMLKTGWCIHQINALCSRVSFVTLIYLANLRRHQRPGIDHSICEAESKCIAYNINDETFESVHVVDGCRCRHITTSNEDLTRILREGDIPVLRCERKPSGQIIASYVRASPGLKYTAISHLWADGLGNPRDNSLPRCQLERIVAEVEKATPAVSRYGYVGDVGFGISSNLGAAARVLLSKLTNLARIRQKGTVVNIWLDVYCVPVLPRPANRDSIVVDGSTSEPSEDAEVQQASLLKQAAISRMDATYSWANYVLVLDKELSQVNFDCNELEFLARVGVSAWNTRCWTYQEYALARIAAYQCQHAATFRHVAKGKEVEEMGFWSIRPIQRKDQIYGIHRDLEALALPAHVNTGATVRNPRLYEPWRTNDPEVKRFVDAWNAFVGRNTTKAEDLIGIFSNLLDLSASRVLELQKDMRMKAIFASQSRLPLSLLFVECERRSQLLKTPPTISDMCERWLSASPQSSVPLWDREFSFHVHVTPHGLLLRPSEIVGSRNAMLIRIPIAEGSHWTVFTNMGCYWITFDREELEFCLEEDSNEAVLVLYTSNAAQSLEEPGVGALLLSRSFEEAWATTVVFVCPVRWRLMYDTTRGDGELVSVQGTIIEPDDLDILLRCNIAAWPKLSLKRHHLASKRSTMGLRTVKWLLIGACTIFLSLMLTLVLTRDRTDGTAGRLILAAMGVLILTVPLALLVNGTLERAHEYLLLHTMEAGEEASRPWWEQLSEILNRSSRDSVDPLERIQAGILRGVVVLMKIYAYLKTWCRRRHILGDEGGISLT